MLVSVDIVDDDSAYITVSDYGEYEIMFMDDCGISDSILLNF